MNIFDLLKLNKIVTSQNYRKFIEIKGSSNLIKSIKRGKGTIAVIGHFQYPVLQNAGYNAPATVRVRWGAV
jgi:lauroyl/myristoyl acyltransferase